MCAPNTPSKDDSSPRKNSVSSLADQTISMSAGRLMTTLVAVALGVFLATAHFYSERSSLHLTAPSVGKRSAARIFPSRNPNRTSRAVTVKTSGSNNNSASSTTAASEPDGAINIDVGNVASEVGIVIALQAIFPVVSRAIVFAKRIRWASLGVRVTPAFGRMLKTFGNVWHTLMLAYKKTSASKIVTRTKKMVKILKHDDDDHHDHEHDDDEHGHETHHDKKVNSNHV